MTPLIGEFELLPFQAQAAMRLQRRAVLVAPLGAGKTYIGLGILDAAFHRGAERALIVAPPRVLREVWAPAFNGRVPAVPWKALPLDRPAIAMLSNRAIMQNVPTTARSVARFGWRPQAVIIDEASMLSGGKHAAALRRYLKHADPDVCVAMTATPLHRGLMRAWGLYALVVPAPFGFASYTEYVRETHADVSPRHLTFPIYRPRPGALEIVAAAARPDTEVVTPSYSALPVTRATDRIALSADDRRRYKEAERAVRSASTGQLQQHGAKVGELRQLAQRCKPAAFARLMEGVSEPLLVWLNYRRDRAAVHDVAKRLDLPIKDVGDRGAVAAWNAGKLALLVANPAEAAHGLNLQAGGRAMLWLTLPWSLELYEQGVGRLARRGQKHTVHVRHLVAAGTVEEAVVSALIERRNVAKAWRAHLSV